MAKKRKKRKSAMLNVPKAATSRTKRPKQPKATSSPAPAEQTSAARPIGWTSAAARKRTSECANCGAVHMGDSEELLHAFDPEVAVFYDRDVAETENVVGLCGPRFRLTSDARLHAHYGTPQGAVYRVFAWQPEKKSWSLIIDTAPRTEGTSP
jgi:hypothetical protein